MHERDGQAEGALGPETLFRYLVVAKVLARIATGKDQSAAVDETVDEVHYRPGGGGETASRSSIYRWLANFRIGGIGALANEPRITGERCGGLPEEFLKFAASEKLSDPDASIPEIMLRALERGLLLPDPPIHRSQVYKVLRRMGVDVRRKKHPTKRGQARRFAYPHRMALVLCDGKHFRAGKSRVRRVALFFLDNATRFGLGVVVGTTESADLFQRGLYVVLRAYGHATAYYVDNGPGFIADDSIALVANLGSLLIHGTASYPEGRGMIERFNQTVKKAVLRGFDGKAAVDPEPSALELRLAHYLSEVYNHQPHEALGGATPWQRFHDDPKPLVFAESDVALRSRFVVTLERTVSGDNVVSIDGAAYEMPAGHAGRRVKIQRRLLDARLQFHHQGRAIELHPVDLAANATAYRPTPARPEFEPVAEPPTTAADLAFEADFRPLVGDDGSYSDEPSKESHP